MKDPISVLPTREQCQVCPKPATMQLDQVPLCDTHAEIAMTSVCGRYTKIKRGN